MKPVLRAGCEQWRVGPRSGNSRPCKRGVRRATAYAVPRDVPGGCRVWKESGDDATRGTRKHDAPGARMLHDGHARGMPPLPRSRAPTDGLGARLPGGARMANCCARATTPYLASCDARRDARVPHAKGVLEKRNAGRTKRPALRGVIVFLGSSRRAGRSPFTRQAASFAAYCPYPTNSFRSPAVRSSVDLWTPSG